MPFRQTPIEQHGPDVESATQQGRQDGAYPHTARATPAWGVKRGAGGPPRRVIVVGAPEDIPRALGHRSVVEGRFDARAVLAIPVGVPDAEADVSTLGALLPEHQADAILVAGPIGAGVMRRVTDIALVHRCELLAVMPAEVLSGHEPVVVWTGDSHLVCLASMRDRHLPLLLKRAIDCMGAAIGLVIFAPLLAVLAIAITLESRGPVFYRQERLGRGGVRFWCLKLRTMRHDAEELLWGDEVLYATYRTHSYKVPDNADGRITALGRVLRRTSVDELPQLWNVLRGDMSLVGPRPVVDDEIGEYGTEAPLLLSMRPGITGNWAVNGRHGVGYPERCALELEYVRSWSLATDARIAKRTLAAVVNPGG